MEPDPVSGHRFLHSSHCLKLDPIGSLHPTLSEEGGEAAWGLGANRRWPRPARGSGIGSVSLERSLRLSGPPLPHQGRLSHVNLKH